MKIIQAIYTVTSEWNLTEICDHLGIDSGSIKSYFVKWDELHLTYTDDRGKEQLKNVGPNIFSASESFDWKTPDELITKN